MASGLCPVSLSQLLQVYRHYRPAPAVADCLRSAGLWTRCCLRRASSGKVRLCSYRGRRAGRRRRRPLPNLRQTDGGIPIVTGNRPSPWQHRDAVDRQVCLRRIDVERNSSSSRQLVFGSLNIRSLTNKLDDLLEVRQDQQIDVLFLAETWLDIDSVCLRRLLTAGYQVVDRPRPRSRDDTLSSNHGGVAVVAVHSVRLETVDLGPAPETFEFLCVHIVSGPTSCVVGLVYRPGSAAVSATFFTELADVLDRLATFVDPVMVVGDFNIRVDRPDDTSACRFLELLSDHGLTCLVDVPTHELGGTLDIVAGRLDTSLPHVEVVDVGLSDHHLLRWPMFLTRQPSSYVTVTSRPWRQLDHDAFRDGLMTSPLCRPSVWSQHDIDGLARLYDDEIGVLLDRLLPQRTVSCRRRPSDPWFDDECRTVKRCVRRLERAARHANRVAAASPNSVTLAAATRATTAWKAVRRAYRELRDRKRETFWQEKVEAERSTPRRLWQSVDQLMGRGHVPLSNHISADELHQFFDNKVAGVRSSTAGAPPPTFCTAPTGCSFPLFRRLSVDDVIAAVRLLPDKQCASDALPTSLLKGNVDLLAPYLVELYNRSMTVGSVPLCFKAAYVTPLLKKPDMDAADLKSYRPISNLSVLSKLLERLVAGQLLEHLNTWKLLPELQSAYRAGHSTETAVLKVLSDILSAVDRGDLAMLVLLDLSAAFDTVDHKTLLRRLKVSYGIAGTVLSWFRSYLRGRRQYVRCTDTRSALADVLCGVPQGSVLGPILFLLYTADLLQLVQERNLHPHLYADDTQIYGSCAPGDTSSLQEQVTACTDDVAMWMRSNRLQLNTAKTEVLWCTSVRRQHQLPNAPLQIGSDAVMPVSCVRDLGIYIDSDLSMKTHISRTVSSCFAAMRQIRSIRRSVSQSVLQSLVVSLVLTRLDYGSATLAGLPKQQLDRLQSVLNAAARLVYTARRRDHVTPLLMELHWLRVHERINFRLAVLVYRCLQESGPTYLARDLRRVADVTLRGNLRSST